MATAFGLRERRLRHRGRYATYLRQLSERQWWSTEQLELHSDRLLHQTVQFCYERVPYYRALFRALGVRPEDIRSPRDLGHLPILEKESVRAEPQRFIPDQFDERLIEATTGGTTGTPLRYFVSPSALQFNYAAYESRFRRWAGVAFGDKIASFNGRPIVPMTQSSPPFWRHNLAFNQLYFSAYHLAPENLSAYVSRLSRFSPRVIVGYVSAVHTLSRFILDHNLVGAVRPTAVLVSSETLFPWVRADIQNAFGCKAWNGYGLGELTAFVSECEAGSMHISPDYGVVEFVSNDDGFELITTGLFNRAMPLLRYRTGDLGTPMPDRTQCECGRWLPRCGDIVGRVDEAIITADGSKVGPAAMSLAFQGVAHLRQAQVHQNTPGEIAVKLVVDEFFGANEREHLSKELQRRLGGTMQITLETVPDIPRTAAGKERLIISRVPGASN